MRSISIFLIFTAMLMAKVNCATTIEPVQFLVEQIGKNRVSVFSMVTKGASAHTYEPKPSQMKALAKTRLYFAISTEFEDIWIPRFKSANNSLIIIKTDTNIKKLPSIKHSHHDEEEHHHTHAHVHDHNHEHHHHHSNVDTHIWLRPKNMILIARSIANALSDLDKQNQAFYASNLKNLEIKLKNLDKETMSKLDPFKGKSFLVFHPAWQYFAHQYGLKQIAIETEGKEPKPKELQETIKFAKENKIKAIFAHSNQSTKSANVIAKEIKAKVIVIDPLEYNYFKMIGDLSDRLKEALVD